MSIRVLVIGASPFQVPLIHELNAMGAFTVSISNRKNDPGLKISSKGINISITDVNNIEKIFIEQKIDYSITCGSDLGTYIVAHLNNKFHVKGVTTEQILSVTHKGYFNKILKKLKLNHKPFITITEESDPNLILSKITSFPIILKPFISSGSRGVIKVNSFEEIISNHNYLINSSHIMKGYVAQEYIQGVEIGAECLIENYKVVFLEFTTKFNTQSFVPIGHFVPNVIDNKIRKEIKDQIEYIISYVKIKNTSINIDIIINDKDSPFIIDMSFRLGGNMLPDLMKKKFEIDPYKRIIQHMLNDKLEDIVISNNSKNFGSIIFNANKKGILTTYKKQKINSLLSFYNISEVVFDILENESYSKYVDGSKRFGHAIGEFDSLEHYKTIFSKMYNIIEDD